MHSLIVNVETTLIFHCHFSFGIAEIYKENKEMSTVISVFWCCLKRNVHVNCENEKEKQIIRSTMLLFWIIFINDIFHACYGSNYKPIVFWKENRNKNETKEKLRGKIQHKNSRRLNGVFNKFLQTNNITANNSYVNKEKVDFLYLFFLPKWTQQDKKLEKININ